MINKAAYHQWTTIEDAARNLRVNKQLLLDSIKNNTLRSREIVGEPCTTMGDLWDFFVYSRDKYGPEWLQIYQNQSK